MPSGAKSKTARSSVHLLIGMAVFALIVAVVAVPVIAEATGVSQNHVTYVVAAICFVFAIVASRWARSLNEKKSAE
ncbi:MAG: hypothetical protein EXQ82_00820 [Pseudolabrys sp.]|nr:hypothetical protein [Pseudolabrys sp.]